MGCLYFSPTSYNPKPRLPETPGPARKVKRANRKPKVKMLKKVNWVRQEKMLNFIKQV